MIIFAFGTSEEGEGVDLVDVIFILPSARLLALLTSGSRQSGSRQCDTCSHGSSNSAVSWVLAQFEMWTLALGVSSIQ